MLFVAQRSKAHRIKQEISLQKGTQIRTLPESVFLLLSLSNAQAGRQNSHRLEQKMVPTQRPSSYPITRQGVRDAAWWLAQQEDSTTFVVLLHGDAVSIYLTPTDRETLKHKDN